MLGEHIIYMTPYGLTLHPLHVPLKGHRGFWLATSFLLFIHMNCANCSTLFLVLMTHLDFLKKCICLSPCFINSSSWEHSKIIPYNILPPCDPFEQPYSSSQDRQYFHSLSILATLLYTSSPSFDFPCSASRMMILSH